MEWRGGRRWSGVWRPGPAAPSGLSGAEAVRGVEAGAMAVNRPGIVLTSDAHVSETLDSPVAGSEDGAMVAERRRSGHVSHALQATRWKMQCVCRMY